MVRANEDEDRGSVVGVDVVGQPAVGGQLHSPLLDDGHDRTQLYKRPLR